MKKIKYNIIFSIATGILLAFTACNDNFLERYPLDDISNETYWNSAQDLELYNNNIYDLASAEQFYQFYLGHNEGFRSIAGGTVLRDQLSDNQASHHSRYRKYTEIRTGHNQPETGTRSAWGIGGWYWDILRPINIFLENYQKADINEELKKSYAGEVKLFRAWFYFDKVARYGDVQWVNKSVNIDDDEILYGARTPRNEVMDSVLADINDAVAWLPKDWNTGESPGRLNKWAALALKSRICLFEGTYRKYHGTGGHEPWLQEAANAAKMIIDEGPFSIYSTGRTERDYHDLFTKIYLKGNPEVIHWKKYVDGINSHFAIGYGLNYGGGFTKDLVDDYLCTDGLPVATSPIYQGDDDLEDVFVNRDPRLKQSILDPKDAIDIKYNNQDGLAYPRLIGMAGGARNMTGYHLYKYYDYETARPGYPHQEVAAIVLRYGEVLLNYAEAKAELGAVTQGDLDISINRLRDRVGMPHLGMNPPLDPKYANEGLSSLIVEIRRERRIELMTEGLRYDDLMRWKKGEYLTKRALGIRFEPGSETKYPGTNVKTYTDPVSGKTYLDAFKGTPYENLTFDESKHYLWPIPLGAKSQNPNLGQNPGW